jgi:hypothetical protein
LKGKTVKARNADGKTFTGVIDNEGNLREGALKDRPDIELYIPRPDTVLKPLTDKKGLETTKVPIPESLELQRQADLPPQGKESQAETEAKIKAETEKTLEKEPWEVTKAEFESGKDIGHHGTDAEFDIFDINKGKKWDKFGL